jgi:hypothetical protein
MGSSPVEHTDMMSGLAARSVAEGLGVHWIGLIFLVGVERRGGGASLDERVRLGVTICGKGVSDGGKENGREGKQWC